MSKRNGLIAVIAFLLGVFVSNGQNRIPEGAKPYSPTRLQWLALDMEAQGHLELSEHQEYSIDFVPLDKQNAILVYVRYMPKVDREIMNSRVENEKDIIKTKAKYEGWSSWLKVTEDVKMVDVTKK
jgi:hypothetical protein